MKQRILRTLLVVGASAALSVASVRAQTIFDNTGSYNGSAFGMTNGLQIGNEITSSGGPLRSFSIEYLATSALATTVGVDVRFYLNDGSPFNGAPTPGSLLFDSGWYYNTFGGIQSSPTGNDLTYNQSDFAVGNTALWRAFGDALPTDFTFTISWTGITPNEIEMPLANNTPGETGFYWVDNNGVWTLNSYPGNNPNANFLVDFTGPVPEPSTVGLVAIGGALLLGIKKLRRKV